MMRALYYLISLIGGLVYLFVLYSEHECVQEKVEEVINRAKAAISEPEKVGPSDTPSDASGEFAPLWEQMIAVMSNSDAQ